MRNLLSLLLAGLLLFILGCGGGSGGNGGNGGNGDDDPINPPPTDDRAEWTVMVYMGADNNLAPCALADIDELEQVGSTSDVHFTVLADVFCLVQTLWGDIPFGILDENDSLVTPMMHISKHPEEGVQSHLSDPSAVLYQNVGFNSADPGNLTNFIKWSAQRFPAKRYALIVWDHGSSWLPGRTVSAAVYDDYEAHGEAMYIHEIESAIRNSGIHLDLLDFTACNMASVEVAYQLKDVTDYICASQKVMWVGSDGVYESVAGFLTSNPTSSAESVGKVFVDAYISTYTQKNKSSVTHSLIRTERLPAIAGAMSELTPLLSNDAIISSEDLLGTFTEPIRFHQDADICNYANVLPYHSQNPILLSALNDVKEAVSAAVVYNRGFTTSSGEADWTWGAREFDQGEDINVAGATGLSIFLPTSRDWTQNNFGYYNSIAFSNATGWPWVIRHAYEGIPYLGTAPGNWLASLTWSTGVNLDLWVFEPDGYGSLVPASPALGTRGLNGYLSGDSRNTWVSYESYETFPKVIWGPYFFLAVYYSNNLFSNSAYCVLDIYDPPRADSPSVSTDTYFISATQPLDPDFGPGVVYFGFALYNPDDGYWYFFNEDRTGQSTDQCKVQRIADESAVLEGGSLDSEPVSTSWVDEELIEQYRAQGRGLAQELLENPSNKD